jgi:hypothetical protein
VTGMSIVIAISMVAFAIFALPIVLVGFAASR